MLVIVTPKATKQFDHLPPPEQRKIRKRLSSIEIDPYIGKKLSGEFTGQRSLKSWPYRIIYWINEKQKATYIISILHRQGAYK